MPAHQIAVGSQGRLWGDHMSRIPLKCTMVLLIGSVALASCGGRGFSSGGGGSGSGTAPVVLTMTDTPPTNVSILSAEVTLTGATLNPGSVSVFSGSTTLELTRLQTDIAFIGTTLVPPGSYTGLTLTFSNPMLTFENDTTSPIVAGVGSPTPTCAIGAICTIQSVATNLTTMITLSPTMTVSATSGAGLLADVNLNNLLSATLGADFVNGVTVSEFTPASASAPPVGAEDVVGHVTSTDATNSKFSLQNAVGTVSLTVDSTTAFLNFGTCTAPSIACVQTNQILSVDISIRADGTPVARNVLLEDADSTDIEVEGVITSTGSLTFKMVTLAESAAITGLPIGTLSTVTYAVTTPFDTDFIQADSTPITTGFLFSSPADLIVGQQVQVRRNPNPTLSSGASIAADRVRLRSSRVSGRYQTGPPTLFTLDTLPSLFVPRGAAVIQVQTSVPTICAGIGTGTPPICSLLAATHIESVRGPLFANSGSPTLVASKVLQH
jgi:hypothetical protein